uniref:G-protein coupled receptors family 3 profile domain-containing protein n=1 Tax=Globisporangium ultimum (strain ATCC 200006 / CBS 805.95 / DAOM BR144) TaxID=431595 RepID=K3WZZ8_GLOUD
MKVANQERDVRGRLVYLFLQSALKYLRYQAASVYANVCIPDGASIYGVGEVDALLMFWKAILLCLGLYISFLIRNVSAGFQESSWIFGSAVVVLIGTVVILLLAYLVDMATSTLYIFLACSFLIGTLLIMGFMLVPKLFRLNEVSRNSDRTINSMNRIASKRGSATILGTQ